jgi:hypothetical protein
VSLEDGERVLAQAPIGVVERDRHLVRRRSALAARARRQLRERETPPSGIG